ncbi:MAG: OprD family outer membrane porin, partial [Thauera sp.]|nr:OprD family outer membrane porin [Thauera sp.]
QLSYTVQSGAAKDLSVRLRASALRVSEDARAYNSEPKNLSYPTPFA